jgi:hypothetical protein
MNADPTAKPQLEYDGDERTAFAGAAFEPRCSQPDLILPPHR